MNRLGTALLAAIEAVVTVGVGIGIALVPLTLLWGFEYGLQVDWDVFWKATGSVWLIGHGVDVSFVLGSALAKSSGVTGAAVPIHVTLAALGFAIVTAWLGARAGRRFAETEHRVTGLLVGTGVVAVLGLGVALSSRSAATDPTIWQAVVLPALWFGVPALVASEVCRRRRGLPADLVTQRVVDLLGRIPEHWRQVAAFGLRAGTAATAAIVAVAGVVVAFLLFGSFAEVISLYERSHAGIVGGIALTVGQLAFLPDLVGWATAWLIGPGFAIGTGSSVSPVGTVLGPIPGIPVFGALPVTGHAFGLVWVLVPVVAGFAAGGLLRPRLVRTLGTADSALLRALGGVATGVVAGVLAGLVAWLTSGSFGPGRLADVGPHAFLVGGFAALEVGVPAIVALAVGSDLVRLPEGPWSRERWHEADADDDVSTVGTADAAATGSLLAALDQAGAGRTTDVHRFVVEEVHGGPSRRETGPVAGEPDEEHTVDATVPERVAEPSRASRPTDAVAVDTDRNVHGHEHDASVDADSDVDLPDWARTDAVASDRLANEAEPSAPRTLVSRAAGVRSALPGAGAGVSGIRDRLRDAADSVRGRAGELRDRVTGADVDRLGTDDVHDEAPGTAPHEAATDAQPAFPWSTEEFVAGRDDVDDADAAADARSQAVHAPAPAPGSVGSGRPAALQWDATDQIPEDELPWWRKPKSAE